MIFLLINWLCSQFWLVFNLSKACKTLPVWPESIGSKLTVKVEMMKFDLEFHRIY